MSTPTAEQLIQLQREAADLPWVPASYNQLTMLNTEVDQLLFGGSAGGGKSDALIGYSMLRSKSALLLRREFKQLSAIQDRITEIMGGREHYRAADQLWTYPDGRSVELGSCPNVGDESKYQGKPHDALLIDEGAHFDGSQIEFLTGWLRSADGRPCRLIVASNPPLGGQASGIWMIDWWKPWLDPSHPNPAKGGEVRWFARVDSGQMEEVPADYPNAISRTYIPSRLKDNPFLNSGDYERRLRALPPELAEALLNGDFFGATADRPLAVIPNSWIRAAQARWKPDCDLPITHVGVDVARGGRDRCVITVRRRYHVDEQIILPREQCLSGGSVAARVLDIIGDSSPWVRVDVIGVGSSVYDHLQAYLGALVEPVTASAAATAGANGSYNNRRAQDWWTLRERLDPASSVIELPPSAKLYSELAAPEYTLNARGILVEGKESLIKKLGRSIDLADSLVLACAVG
jgi:hypothetical protein